MTSSQKQKFNDFAQQLDDLWKKANAAVKKSPERRQILKTIRELMDSNLGHIYFRACVDSGKPIPEYDQGHQRF